MLQKHAIEALDRNLQDIRSNSNITGGMVVLLAGDIRKTLAGIHRGTPVDGKNACLKACTLSRNAYKLHLTTNIGVELHNDTESGEFASKLLKLGGKR